MTPREKIAWEQAHNWCDEFAPNTPDFARRLLMDIMLNLMDTPRNKEFEADRISQEIAEMDDEEFGESPIKPLIEINERKKIALSQFWQTKNNR